MKNKSIIVPVSYIVYSIFLAISLIYLSYMTDKIQGNIVSLEPITQQLQQSRIIKLYPSIVNFKDIGNHPIRLNQSLYTSSHIGDTVSVTRMNIGIGFQRIVYMLTASLVVLLSFIPLFHVLYLFYCRTKPLRL